MNKYGYIFNPFTANFDAVTVALDAANINNGTPNSFAGFDAAGNLESIPGWLFDSVTDGAQVNLSLDPNVSAVSLHDFYSAFNPSASNANNFGGESFRGDYDVPNSGFDSGNWDQVQIQQIHRGDGSIGQMRSFFVFQQAGNGSNVGSVSQLDTATVLASVASGFTINDGIGLEVQFANSGTVSNNYTLGFFDSSGSVIGNDLSGVSISLANDATNNIFGLNVNNGGNPGNSLNLFNSNNSGSIAQDMFIFTHNNSGSVGNNFFGFNIANGVGSTIGANMFGFQLSNQATVAQNIVGYNLNNSGVVTKGLIGYSIVNSANVGDGTGGADLRGLDLNFNTGSVNGNIYGLNIFNTMPVVGNNTIFAVNMNNQGAGYRFDGVSISNTANFSEEIRGFQFNSVGNSRTSTLLDIGTNGVVTNDANGIRLNMQGSAQQVNGISVDLSGIVSSDVTRQKSGLSITDGSFGVQSVIDTSLYTPSVAFGNNFIGGQFHIATGFPVSGVFGFGNNLGITIFAEDDMAADLFLGSSSLGFSVNGFVNQLAVVSGKTVDTINYMAAGGSFPASSTGGTVVNLSMYRALGVLPGGGTLNITNMYGFKVESTLSSGSPTNSWGFWNGDGLSNNWFKKNVIIGGATGLSVGGYELDISGTGFIAQTLADSSVVALTVSVVGDSTVNGSNNLVGMQGTVLSTVQTGAYNDKATAGVVYTVERGNGTDDGILEELNGTTAILLHNSGVAGVTNKAVGFDVAVITQQGTITDLFDFRSQRIPSGGTVTNHYGLYIQDDATTPILNWIAGKSLFGFSSFAAPTATIHLPPVTTSPSSAPIKLDSGTLMTTPENGAIESDGTDLFWTDDTGTRQYLNNKGGNRTVDVFSGDGATTGFTLSVSPGSVNNCDIFISGVEQNKSSYTIVGTALTFSQAPPPGANNIEANSGSTISIGTPAAGTVGRTEANVASLFPVPVVTYLTTGVSGTSGTHAFTGTPIRVEVELVGPGAGGSGGGLGSSVGGAGVGATTFDTLIGNPGVSAGQGAVEAIGGTGIVGAGWTGIPYRGGAARGIVGSPAAQGGQGGTGGASMYGGNGGGGWSATTASAAEPDSGSGGGGGGCGANDVSGQGGSAGGGVKAEISGAALTALIGTGAAWTIGTKGIGTVGFGTGGNANDGADGRIKVTEYYQ